ncbi:uncharacterized protein F5Z01DRAFT_630578, partial [Emericellopsis atlantica]
SFEIRALSKDAEFFSDAEGSPTTIEGSGQTVYWMGCFLRVYKATDTKTPTAEYDTCDGEGTVQRDTKLWFGGKDGKVKEGN